MIKTAQQRRGKKGIDVWLLINETSKIAEINSHLLRKPAEASSRKTKITACEGT